jgi:hypothetical protein
MVSPGFAVQKSLLLSLLPPVPPGVGPVDVDCEVFTVPSGETTVVVVVVVTEPSLLVEVVTEVVVFVPSDPVVVVGGGEVVDVLDPLTGLTPVPIQIVIPLESAPA